MSAILSSSLLFFFFNDTSTTEIYTLSLHDALPIFAARGEVALHQLGSVLRQRSAVIAGPRPVAVRRLADDVAALAQRLEHNADVEGGVEGVLDADLDVVEIDEDCNLETCFCHVA